ncbi:MAG TPA: hypothetical protein DCF63_02410 [Planctomycetaceae bacterium]|nr:hypothetical protein [Planctomycetaceae bacterium]
MRCTEVDNVKAAVAVRWPNSIAHSAILWVICLMSYGGCCVWLQTSTLLATPPDSVPATPSARPFDIVELSPPNFDIQVLNSASELPAQPENNGSMVTLAVKETPLHSVLSLIAQQQGLSIVSPSSLNTNVTVTLQPTTLENALDAVMAVSGCTWTRHKDVIYVTTIDKSADNTFLAQGRMVQIYDLNYMAADDAEKVVTGLLSPVGKVFTRKLASDNKRANNEQLVVEDLPQYVARISEYIARADLAPRQVMVEVRVLQVKLSHDGKHGVNLDGLLSNSGSNEVWFRTKAFASSTGPGAVFTVDSGRFDKLIDILATTTDAKTLAAPKLLMLNGQESRIQIGQRLAYTTSTTTQTVTVQGVQFLEVGVLLHVTPHITEDGQILMKVHPKVSSGQINPTTELPEEDTTEMETSVMVPDNTAIFIGGLIQEINIDRQSKLPILGDIWMIGRLFQRRTVDRERSEVIVALLPRIVPCECESNHLEAADVARTQLPILTPELQPSPRPEPSLPDALRNPIRPLR